MLWWREVAVACKKESAISLSKLYKNAKKKAGG